VIDIARVDDDNDIVIDINGNDKDLLLISNNNN